MTKKYRKRSDNQSGMTSIVVVSILIVILALITLGFARLMSRTVRNAVDSQLGSAAYYASRSAISDAVAYLQTNPTAPDASQCDNLLGPGQELQDESDAVSAASGGVTKYTCILINRQPTELLYQKLPPLKSQVVKLQMPPGNSLQQIILSWQGTNRNLDGAEPAPTGNDKLFSQSEWDARGNEPMLRVTLYRVNASGDTLANVATNSRTFFLYPSLLTSATQTVNPLAGDGSLVDAACPATSADPNEFHCRVTFTQLSGPAYVYARITPLYSQADVKIEGVMNPGNRPAKFIDAQAVIDATAKSNDSVRRLAARVDTSSLAGSSQINISPLEDAMPEFAIRSAATLCKRLDFSGGTVTLSMNSALSALCNLTL